MIRPLQELSSWIHMETVMVSIRVIDISMLSTNMLYSFQLTRFIFSIIIQQNK